MIPRVSRTWVPNHMCLCSFGLRKRKKKKKSLYLELNFWRSQDHFWMIAHHSLVGKASHSHERADGLCNHQTVLRRLQRKRFLTAVVLGEGVCRRMCLSWLLDWRTQVKGLYCITHGRAIQIIVCVNSATQSWLLLRVYSWTWWSCLAGREATLVSLLWILKASFPTAHFVLS